ncbi:MAG TPA: hypothetical protein VFB25_08120 [Gaiellaceae bacterium]|nr:hypothetical protein [Gaiellaceae bacterium]
MTFAKAHLIGLKGNAQGSDPVSPAIDIPVQFNPASLRLTLRNETTGGRSRGQQAQQTVGTGSTDLTFDLHFDTADNQTDVQVLVKQVEQFVLPTVPGSKKAPPRVRFCWGKFGFEGVMTGLQEEIDLFSSEGVPLRAKLGVTIQGQRAKDVATEAKGNSATTPGTKPSTSPGASGPPPPPDTRATALGGESAAAFAARNGVDPNAWRGLGGAALTNPLSLAAGLEIDFSSTLSAAAGLGAQAGVDADADASLEQAFGLQSAGGAAAATAAGFALSAAGGVRAAIETVQTAKSDQAASAARAAFAAPAPAAAAPPPTRPAAPDQPRTPLALTGLPVGPPPPAPAAPAPPRADPRAESFGYGVPLRPQVGAAAAERNGPFSGWVVVGVRPPTVQTGVTTPSWVGLRPVAAAVASRQAAPCGCGCGGGCGCR